MGENILLIDKPLGMTSFDVIRVLRKKLGVRKIGHAGTLDPQASGLLILALDGATRTLSQYLKLQKTYEAKILFGVRTDTGDTEGKIVEEKKIETMAREDIEKDLAEMVATLRLPVPAYSAIKQGGEPLYKKARRGEVVNSPIKEMFITRAKLFHFSCKDGRAIAEIEFDVASGTYIRSLVVELGRRLGVPATLTALRRTRIGDFRVEDAQAL